MASGALAAPHPRLPGRMHWPQVGCLPPPSSWPTCKITCECRSGFRIDSGTARSVIVNRSWLGALTVHLSDLAAAAPDKPAVITADGSRVVTFRQLDERSRQVSRLLAGHGIRPRDHIAVFMAN